MIKELPPKRFTGKWTPGRKISVLEALDANEMTLLQAHEWYDLSAEEIHSWRKALESGGARGLYAKNVKRLRLKKK